MLAKCNEGKCFDHQASFLLLCTQYTVHVQKDLCVLCESGKAQLWCYTFIFDENFRDCHKTEARSHSPSSGSHTVAMGTTIFIQILLLFSSQQTEGSDADDFMREMLRVHNEVSNSHALLKRRVRQEIR